MTDDLPPPDVPPWFRPIAPPAHPIGAWRRCTPCDTTWRGNEPCFACGEPTKPSTVAAVNAEAVAIRFARGL